MIVLRVRVIVVAAKMSLRPNARTEVRRNRYKVAVDADEGRRRREDNMVEIRKSKREESLQKKRREGLQAQQQFPTPLQSSIVEKKVLLLSASHGRKLEFHCDLGNFRFMCFASRSCDLISLSAIGVSRLVMKTVMMVAFVSLLLAAVGKPPCDGCWSVVR